MTTLGIGMMVKNESHIIEKALASCIPLQPDEVVITDTGSIDDTIVKAGLFLQRNNIKFKIYNETFKNFGYNRNLIIQRVKESGLDYVFMLDADERFTYDNNFNVSEFKSNLRLPLYNVRLFTGTVVSYTLPRLTSTKTTAKYIGVTHEYLDYHEPMGFCRGVTIAQDNDSYRRTISKEKLTGDIKLMEDALNEKDIDEGLKIRYYFYIAGSYMIAENYEKAKHFYTLRTIAGGWEQEIFYSYYQLGKIHQILGDTEKAIGYWWRAWEACPTRIESLAALKSLYDKKGYTNLANNLIPLLKSIKHPGDGLFLEDYLYYVWT